MGSTEGRAQIKKRLAGKSRGGKDRGKTEIFRRCEGTIEMIRND
jgi:hypothetical protein